LKANPCFLSVLQLKSKPAFEACFGRMSLGRFYPLAGRRLVIVLYDADCGFCRWAMAWAVRRDRDHVLAPAPIQSPLGSELLAVLAPSERLRSAHIVRDDGSRRSGGAAAADVLSALPATRILGRLAGGFPRTTDRLYRVVAARRMSFGRLVGTQARRRADDLLASVSAPTAAEPKVRSGSQA
jgi:predicted DCC family thiol-disulfide oxidoreductase YuxK